MNFFEYIKSILAFLPAIMASALVWASSIYFLIIWVGGHLAKDKRDNTSLWLQGEYESTWVIQFCLMTDKIFGENLLSWEMFCSLINSIYHFYPASVFHIPL